MRHNIWLSTILLLSIASGMHIASAAQETVTIQDSYTFSLDKGTMQGVARSHVIDPMSDYFSCLNGVVTKEIANSFVYYQSKFDRLIGTPCDKDTLQKSFVISSEFSGMPYSGENPTPIKKISLHSSLPITTGTRAYFGYTTRFDEILPYNIFSDTVQSLKAASDGGSSGTILIPPNEEGQIGFIEHISVLTPSAGSRYNLVTAVGEDTQSGAFVGLVGFNHKKMKVLTVLCGEERRLCKDHFYFVGDVGSGIGGESTYVYLKRGSSLRPGHKVTIVLQGRSARH